MNGSQRLNDVRLVLQFEWFIASICSQRFHARDVAGVALEIHHGIPLPCDAHHTTALWAGRRIQVFQVATQDALVEKLGPERGHGFRRRPFSCHDALAVEDSQESIPIDTAMKLAAPIAIRPEHNEIVLAHGDHSEVEGASRLLRSGEQLMQDVYEDFRVALGQQCGSTRSNRPVPERINVVGRHEHDGDRRKPPTYLDRGRNAVKTIKAHISKNGIRGEFACLVDQVLPACHNRNNLEVGAQKPHQHPGHHAVVFRQEHSLPHRDAPRPARAAIHHRFDCGPASGK